LDEPPAEPWSETVRKNWPSTRPENPLRDPSPEQNWVYSPARRPPAGPGRQAGPWGV